jgi:hypothetical protein
VLALLAGLLVWRCRKGRATTTSELPLSKTAVLNATLPPGGGGGGGVDGAAVIHSVRGVDGGWYPATDHNSKVSGWDTGGSAATSYNAAAANNNTSGSAGSGNPGQRSGSSVLLLPANANSTSGSAGGVSGARMPIVYNPGTPSHSSVGPSASDMLYSTRALEDHDLSRLLIPWSALTITHPLGQGGFGTVYRGSWKGNKVAGDGQGRDKLFYRHACFPGQQRLCRAGKYGLSCTSLQVAVKMLDGERLSDEARGALRQEALMMCRLRHPGIALAYGLVNEEQHQALVMK